MNTKEIFTAPPTVWIDLASLNTCILQQIEEPSVVNGVKLKSPMVFVEGVRVVFKFLITNAS